MKIDCAHDELIDLHKLVPHPKNNNRHSVEQIDRLAKIIDYQGMRSPIVVSKLSGFITKGHCRLSALQKLGYEKAPVNYQDYESEAQEYADITSDNAIALWAELDIHAIHTEIEAFPELELELLGLDFELKGEKLDYSMLEDENIDNEISDKESELRKSIQVSFSLENYEEVLSLVKFWKEREADVGLLLLEKLRTEKASLEN